MLLECCCFLLMVLAYLLWKRRKYLGRLKDFTGPPSLPVIGNVHQLLSIKDVLWANVRWSKIYKNYILYLGLKPYLMVTDHKLVEFLLSSNKFIDKSDDYKLMENWLGYGLLLSKGAKWRKRRKVFTPAFHYSILEDYIQTFESNGLILIDQLEEKVGLDSFNAYDVLNLYTLDVICETAMGTEMNCQKNPNSIYAKSVKDLCEIAYQKCVFPVYQIQSITKFTNLYKKEVAALNVVHGFSKSVIQSRKKIIQEKVDGNKDDFGIRKKSNFLDILLQSTVDGKPLTDEDILEEVETFMFEGHDTTATALSATLYYLSVHPEIQKKVVDELKGVFQGNKTKTLTQQDFQEMKYLEMVIKEALRLCPSVAVHAREMNEDAIFEGKLIPKGITVAIYTFGLHRQPELYPDPEKFDPERFCIENVTSRHPYAYIPFSAGPRNCIGQKFAMLELKSCLSKVLMNFEVLPSKIKNYKPEYICFVTTKSLNGMQIRLEKRQGNELKQ